MFTPPPRPTLFPYTTLFRSFCESIEAREGVTTGISAADRARTIQVAIDPKSGPGDLVRPGHTFPLRARKGGVLVRAGQTERSEEHTSELQSRQYLVCRLLLE